MLCFVLAPGNDFCKILGTFESCFKNFILEFLFFHCENQFAALVASVSPSSLSSTARTIYYCFFEVDDRRHFLLPLSHE